MRLENLQPQVGSRTKVKRVGRGIGSGTGKTSTKGHKGQWARSGGGVRPGFEGGQMPLTRRSPKRGFNNKFRKEYAIVNVSAFEQFAEGTVVNYDLLFAEGLVKEVKNAYGLKVLGNGQLTKKLTVQAKAFSAGAKDAIEKVGGVCELI